ncbi:YhdP family protein [Dyella psychrodurans]|uniref:TIGR02099 family protein n=1 Tax=Dyella psychrodurans TaxID=1927960 RepID=A0A370XES7_9GAMM|nr:YhdP family protein [Dyella psychrodurans]RDS86812.1 TIGR02099 family protein [Dyella psychrodurans]
MSTALQKWVRRIGRGLAWVVGVLVIALAVSAALAQLLLPLLAQHPEWVAAELSSKLQQPVTFASLQGRSEPSGPRFVMRGVTIGSSAGGSPLHVPEVDLKLDFGGWLFPSRHLLNLQAHDLELDLTRDANSQWHINGIGVAGGSERQNISFGRLSIELWLDNLRVDINDQLLSQRYTVIADQLRLTHQSDHVRVGARVHRVGATGELQAAGRFRDDGAGGKFWLAAQNADLHGLAAGFGLGGYTIDSGRGDLAVWMDWSHDQIVRELFQLNVRDLSVTTPTGVKASVPALGGLAELSRREDGYALRWADNDGGALRVDINHLGTPQGDIAAVASQLQLAPLLPWLGLKPGLSPGLAQWLAGGQAHGELQHAVFHWNAATGLQTLDATFDNVGIAPIGKLPGLDHLRGEARGDGEAVSLEVPAQAVTISFPHTFRKPFVMSQLAGDFAAWRDEDATHIGVADMDFEGEAYGGNAQGEVQLPSDGGRPFLDLYIALTHADVSAAKLFWPIDSMSPKAIEWLDQAFVAGKMDNTAVLVRGSLANWPFHHNEGRFEARTELNDLTLSYGKDWPVAQHIQGVANFIDAGMVVQTTSGQSLNVNVNNAVAVIPELAHATLDLNVNGSGNASDMLNFVGSSPIARKQADALAKIKLGGTGSFDFHLSLPMKDMHDFLLDGNAQFKDVDFSAPDWHLQVDKLNGPATFDAHGFHAGPLAGGFRGEPSQLDLAIAGATGDPNTVVAAKLSGNYTVPELIQGYSQLKWLGDIATGRSQFTVGYQIAHATDDAPGAQTLSIDSPMTGVALNFPVPLNKADDDTDLPLHLTMSLPMAGSNLQLALGSVMSGRMRLPVDNQSPLAATFAFGNQIPDSLPVKGMRIRGDATQLDVTGWVRQSIGGSASSGIGLETIDVTTEHAQVFGRDFAQMHISAAPKGDTLELDVDSAAAAGHFSVPTVSLAKRGITARLQRMYWPKEPTMPAKKPGAAPVPVSDPANTGIDPISISPLHFWVHDLRLGDTKLGDARLETWPTASGMHIDELSTHSKSVQINGSGDWNGSPTKSATRLHVSFDANNLGDMLNEFGYEDIFQGGKTHDELDATWPGGPWAFELGSMDGTLKVNVTNGLIPKASPGVSGRFFGLASIAEFPRRLSLNFNDVFGKGFAFDLISGEFQLKDGNAYTDNVKIHGPAAEITITGRTGLHARDYDQQVVILPHVGSSLPVVGAVVAGPIGAAAGFAVQGVLGKGLSHMAVQRYTITGSWDKPVITSGGAEKQAAPAAASSAPAPASAASTAPAVSGAAKPANP